MSRHAHVGICTATRPVYREWPPPLYCRVPWLTSWWFPACRSARIDRVYAYHASLDGTAWQLIRVFVLDDETSRDKIGSEGQSPTGDGCSVTFDEIRFLPDRLADLRDGS